MGRKRNRPSISQEPSARDRVVSPTFPYNDDSVMPHATEFEFRLRPITTASENSTLYTTKWDDIPLPQVLIKADRDGREGDQEFGQWRPLSNDEDSNSQGSRNGARSNYSTVPEQAEGVSSAVDSGYASLPTQGHKAPSLSAAINANQLFSPNGLDTDDRNCSDDAGSIYTAGPDIPPSKKNAYIFSLANDLLNKALMERPDDDGLDRIEKFLPQLLKKFAMKVGSSHSMQIYRDVMVFVRRHRR